MAETWEKVSSKDFLRDVDMAGREQYKMQPHHFKSMKRVPWVVCKKCGLLGLRNDFTRWCEKMGCLHERHPDYARRAKAAA